MSEVLHIILDWIFISCGNPCTSTRLPALLEAELCCVGNPHSRWTGSLVVGQSSIVEEFLSYICADLVVTFIMAGGGGGGGGGGGSGGPVTNLPTESALVGALGHRTLLLHVEMKRLRAWWREILGCDVLEKLSGHTSAVTPQVGTSCGCNG